MQWLKITSFRLLYGEKLSRVRLKAFVGGAKSSREAKIGEDLNPQWNGNLYAAP